MAPVITSIDQLDFSIPALPRMPIPRQVLMIKPTYFSVEYIINPHMAKNVGMVDKMQAQNEWDVLKSTFSQIGITPRILDGQPDLPDMVFSANQSLPYIDEQGKKHVLMSIMHASQRRDEVPFVEQWFRQAGYTIHFPDEDQIDNFEGCGDAIWHTGKRLLWGGYGYRSSLKAYEEISQTFNIPILALKLVDETFYHLDTCFCVLNPKTALIYPGAFMEQGLRLIHSLFEKVIDVTKQEATNLFACNATCPDGKNVIIQQGCTDANKKLRDAGFAVHEVDTGEFLKSGGSVFCMKQMVW